MNQHRYAALALGLTLVSSAAWSQPSGARGDNFIYRVLSGDTLSQIASTYTHQQGNWRPLQTLNHVADTLALPIGKELSIPFSMIPVNDMPLRITHRTGQVSVNGLALGPDLIALKEGDHIQTGNQGYLTLSLQDSSDLLIPANSSVVLKRARAFQGTGLTDTIIALDQGDLESIVAPQSAGVGRFEVHTPISITGVRGTSLRVRHSDQGSYSEVLEGRADLNTQSTQGTTVLAQNFGASVAPDGRIDALGPLPAKPRISAPVRQAGQWTSTAEPDPAAQAYLVQVALDEQGSKQISRYTTADRQFSFRANRPGQYYVLVRAINSQGLMGPDAVAGFSGALVLSSSDGSAIATGFGEPVLLREF